MAIRFVDVEPEKETGKGGGKPKPAKVATSPAGPPQDPPEAVVPALPSAKPESNARGRKKPPTTEGQAAAEPAADGAETPPADGLLPGLQVHAKPTPKPRGRKKAFG